MPIWTGFQVSLGVGFVTLFISFAILESQAGSDVAFHEVAFSALIPVFASDCLLREAKDTAKPRLESVSIWTSTTHHHRPGERLSDWLYRDFCVQQETTGKSAWVGLAGKGARPQVWRHEISLHVSTAYTVERTDFECCPLTFAWCCTHYTTHKANECNNMKPPHESYLSPALDDVSFYFLSLRMF